MTRSILSWAIVAGFELVLASPVPAELVYFSRGGQAQLPANINGNEVRLDTPDGPRIFARDDFKVIVPGHRPLDDWATRRDDAMKAATVEAQFAAAWWALENGLTAEALVLLDKTRPISADHGPTRRAIAQADRLSLPCPEPDLDTLRARLRPLRFRESRSSHVVLLHQHSEAEARERLETLEKVVQTFLVAFAAQGIELDGPKQRLVSVYFNDRRDYARTLRQVGGDAFADTQGYYHPALRTVFACDTRSGEDQKTARRAIQNRKRDGASASDLARQSLLLDLEWRATDLGIAAHETVHQLTVETGLAPRPEDFPSWLLEGLATQFEVVRGGVWAGFGRANDLRLPNWRTIRPVPRLNPLIRDAGFGHGYRRDLYAESWALVYYLRKAQPREFLTFLECLRAPGPVRDDRGVDAFRSSFGPDLGSLETRWRQFIAEVRTPLELGRIEIPDPARVEASLVPKRSLVEGDPGH